MADPLALPRYRSHKTVYALEIEKCTYHGPGDPIMYFIDRNYAPRLFSIKLVSRYNPVAGDFFVIYDDGYESVSPRKAFLEGYDKI